MARANRREKAERNEEANNEKKTERKSRVNSKLILTAVIILLVAGIFAYSRLNSGTGQATLGGNAVPNQPATNQPYQPSGTPGASPQVDPRMQTCNDMASAYQGQQRLDFLDVCSQYLWKLCFSESDCGPFHCTGNKCQ